MIGWQAPFKAAREFEKRQNWSAAVRIYKSLLKAGEIDNARINYQLGNALFRSNDLGQAEQFLRRAIDLEPGNAAWHYRLAFVLERQGRHELSIEHYQSALGIDPHKPAWHYRLFKCYSALGDKERAMDNLLEALNGDPTNPRYHDLVAADLRTKGPRWQEAQALERGLPHHEEEHAWHVRMGASYAALSRHQQSAASYRIANKLKSGDAKHLFLEGEQWERAGDLQDARAAFSAGIALDPDSVEARFGIGAYYQGKGDWDRASSAYELRKNEHPLDAELHFRAGLAQDRCFRWDQAAENYISAIALNEDQPYWHYKLGFSYERMGAWSDAASAYEYAASKQPGNHYWWYRAGFACVKMGEFEKACDFLLRSSPIGFPTTEGHLADQAESTPYEIQIATRRLQIRDFAKNPEFHRRTADAFAAAHDWDAAADGYERAVLTSNSHDPQLYYLWGNALAQSRQFEAAAHTLIQSRIFMTPDGIDVPKYLKNKSQKHSMQYLEYYESIDIRPRTILWESNHGSTVGCHPLAIFRHLVDLPEFSGYRHVWAVNDPSVVPEDVRRRSNVFFATPHSDLYLRVLATASHLINNVSFPPYFMRREGQRYLNTWHGTPFKTLGKDMRGEAMEHSNLARNFLHSSHIMSPNDHTSWAIIDRHDLTGLFKGKIRVTGSPRLDRMINIGDALRSEIRNRLDLSDDRPVVLYAPTWRGSTTDRVLDSAAIQADLLAMAGSGHHLIFRAHRLTEKLLAGLDLGVTIVPADIDTSDLLAAVDVLVTDYSSIAFDFMPTKRPIVYYTYDFDEYSEQRGLYLDESEMPGDFCRERSELASILESAVSGSTAGPREEYVAAVKKFAPFEDGRAAARVTDFFFNDEVDIDDAADEVPVALFHHSLIPNGIATSFRNLARSLPNSDVRKVLVVEPHVLNKDQGRLSQLDLLPTDVQLVGRIGQQSLRPEERWLQDKFTQQHSLASAEQWKIYMGAMKREFYRIFGPATFDSIIEFDGYSPFWASLMASGGTADTTHSIYLHNDMFNEWKMKFPNLEAIFKLYDYFENMISVSESLSNKNAAYLGTGFGIDASRFVYCNNQIDAKTVLSKAKDSVDADIAAWFSRTEHNILAIGRLSPEKDHAKLIRAFIAYHNDHPDSNLIIIGDGPLRDNLRHQITSSGAEDYIMLAGQRLNPYPALSSASAFVLSSLHEGQPMVLFEAMILRRPIICTDMPGPRDVLQNRYGLIVDNSEEGLLHGLSALHNGSVPQDLFDSAAYTVDAKSQFLLTTLMEAQPADANA
ncbi:CDP-glycerol glycerophosphotransferase family protein [Arthrobacter sp. 08Y14]|uniref:CDP-glycerol glycerophosphotransferase family protein n=1 Tax=Arthrobacter sp. 08Y14 TaxID=2058885 RepID=UPI000CE3DF9B|nr:CDP-glycerol glycerophosphotransferase family protein [Arthrobacter sp. 08Y14]